MKRFVVVAIAAIALLSVTSLTSSGKAATPISGASSGCDAFTVSILGFDITSFPEPGWVWVDSGDKLKSVSGSVVESFVTHTDFPAVHDSHDQNTHLKVDPGYEGLLSDVNDPGEIEMEWEIGTFPSETSGDPPERTFPRWVWPSAGDRAWFNGNWIFDCGHPDDSNGTNRYHTEIHPPRAIASMRDQMHTLPGTGTTPVRVTATDLYVHGRAGFVMDDLTCGQNVILGAGSCSPDPYPGRGTPIDADYDFDVCLPPKPVASAVLATSMENGPGNTLSAQPGLTPQPAAGACATADFAPTQLHVHVPLAGSGATPDDILARKIYAGWVYPPDGLQHITLKLTKAVLHNDQDLDPGDCECSFFWLNMDRAGDEWFRLTPYEVATDDDAGFGCLSNTNTLNDWDDDGGCGNGSLNFTGPTFDFYVANGQDYTLRTVAYDQDCLDDLFGNHNLLISALGLAACFIPPENGDNDSYDAATATNVAAGSGVKVSNPPGDFDLFFDVSSAPVTTEDSADLSLIKACKPDLSPARAGQQFTCTIVVSNPGPGLPRNVVVRDTQLTSVAPTAYVMDTPSFTFSGGGTPTACDPPTDIAGGKQFQCTLGTVPVSGSAVISYHVTSNEGGDFNNFASITTDSTDPNTGNNSAQSSVHVDSVSDLSVTKTAPATSVAGTSFTYDITVHNAGPSTATNVRVDDVVPAGVSIVNVTGSGSAACTAGVAGNPAQPTSCAFGTLAPGATRTEHITVLVDPATLGQLNNTATASADTLDLDNANNSATTATTVTASADLAVAKAAQPTPNVVAGQLLTYKVTISSNGPSLARNVTMTDTLPAGVSLASTAISTGSGICALLASPPNTLSCHLGNLQPGDAIAVYINVLVAASVPNGTVLGNDATAGSNASDGNTANNSAHVDVTAIARADLAIAKTADKDTYKPSSTINYTITVTNNGSSDAQAVVVTDNLPDTKQAIYVFDSGGCTKSLLTLTCSFGTIKAGGTRSVNVYVTVKGSKGQVTNVASVASATVDPNAADNSATRVVLIGK